MELCFDPQVMPLEHWSAAAPAQTALITSHKHYSWQQLQREVVRFVQAMVAAGVVACDSLVLVGKNHSSFIWYYLAAVKLGVKVSFIAPSPQLQLCDKLQTLAEPGCHLWLYSTDGIQSSHCQPLLCKSVTWLELSFTDSDSCADYTDLDGYQPENIATLTFTSGSMGKPKAVAHTHQQHFASAAGLLEQFRYRPGDTWLLSLPLYHVSGLAIVYRWLVSGACLKIGDGVLAEDIDGVTHASLVPVQLQRLIDSQQALTLTHVLLGGSHIPQELCQAASQLGIETWLGYGMTEAASTVAAKAFDGQPGTGYVLDKRKIKIDNQRIYIAGETLALGYYEQGKLTSLTNADGWFDTKDLGHFHGEQLLIKGRADNMFISGGENIHCEEIETVLTLHPMINAAVVVPIKDAEFGQRPIAVISSSSDLPDISTMENWLAGRLEKFKWPIGYLALPSHLIGQGIKLPRSVIKEWVNQVMHHSVMR